VQEFLGPSAVLYLGGVFFDRGASTNDAVVYNDKTSATSSLTLMPKNRFRSYDRMFGQLMKLEIL
jgi:hypothetical protein